MKEFDISPVSNYDLAISLQDILIARATGKEADEISYKEKRRKLMQNSSLSDVIPAIVKDSHSLQEFWGFIKPKFSTYTERSSYIWREFKPILERLEVSNHAPLEDGITEGLKSFDSDGIHAAWQKCLQRKDIDPEGAIRGKDKIRAKFIMM